MGFRLDHRFTQKNLSAYLDGQLTAREKERMERHVAECARCQEELAALRSTVELLHAVPSVSPPRSFELSASAEEERERYHFWSRMHMTLRTATAVVSLLLVLLLSGDLAISQGFIPLSGRTTQDAEMAVEMAEAPQVEEAHIPSPTRDEGEEAAQKEAPETEKHVAGEARPRQAPTQTLEAIEPEVQMLEMEPSPEGPESPTATETATPPRPPTPTATMVPPPAGGRPPAESDQPPVWRTWKWLRTGWTALSGLLLVLFAGVLWTWQKRRLR